MRPGKSLSGGKTAPLKISIEQRGIPSGPLSGTKDLAIEHMQIAVACRNLSKRVWQQLEIDGTTAKFRCDLAGKHLRRGTCHIDRRFRRIDDATEPGTPALHLLKLIKKQIDALAVFFIRQLCKMLGEADALTVNLTQKHMRGRLAESLIILKNKYGYEDDGSTLSIYLSREELANMSNMTTSNAIRILSSLASENIIITDGRKIKIIDEHRLCLISENGG